MNSEMLVVAGKRKRAIAKAYIRKGKGEVLYNGLEINNLPFFHKKILQEPLKIGEKVLGGLSFDIKLKTAGGGKEGQIQAARLAIAKAMIKLTKSEELRRAFINYDRHLLVADTRRKEPYKPGDSKARAKRQKSYR